MAKRTISLNTLKAMGVRIRYLREILGHSQAEWARALGVSPQMLNKWEQGTRQPNIETLIIIHRSSGCTLDYLFIGEIGRQMRQDLREALLAAYPKSPYLAVLFAPVSAPTDQAQTYPSVVLSPASLYPSVVFSPADPQPLVPLLTVPSSAERK
jgi:transcriptional regulator with XRE-family HTH domain